MVKKVIIDTDTGVDDAMALLMALDSHKQGRIQILAITAVNGNTKEHFAVKNIYRTLESVGCTEIPVYRGATEPIVVPYGNEGKYHGEDGFNDVSFENEPDISKLKTEKAWNVMSVLSRNNPGDITLIALGPLTNVAIAMLSDPELSERLSHLYIMGGNMEAIGNVTTAAEFNFHADPEAAHTVLRLSKCPVTMATWELSYKYNFVPLSWRKEELGKLETPQAKLMNQLEEVWFQDYAWGDNWILCDQLAMMAALYPESVLKSSEHVATVELGGHWTRGMMLLDKRPEGQKAVKNVTIIEKLDTKLLMDVLQKAFTF